MKKKLAVLLSIVFATLGTMQTFGAVGTIVNNKTYVPVRGVFEELGFTVNYDNATATTVISNADYTIKVPKGKTYFEVNGKSIKPDSAQTIINGSMYLPLRAIGDSIGAATSWDSANKMAHISYNGKDSYVKCGNTQQSSSSSVKTVATYKENVSVPDFGAYWVNVKDCGKSEQSPWVYQYEILDFDEKDLEKFDDKYLGYENLLSLKGYVRAKDFEKTNNQRVYVDKDDYYSGSMVIIDIGKEYDKLKISVIFDDKITISTTKTSSSNANNPTVATYVEDAGVPDFGAFAGVNLKKKFVKSSSTIYNYSVLDVKSEKIGEYRDLLVNKFGFKYWKVETDDGITTAWYVRGEKILGISLLSEVGMLAIIFGNDA